MAEDERERGVLAPDERVVQERAGGVAALLGDPLLPRGWGACSLLGGGRAHARSSSTAKSGPVNVPSGVMMLAVFPSPRSRRRRVTSPSAEVARRWPSAERGAPSATPSQERK